MCDRCENKDDNRGYGMLPVLVLVLLLELVILAAVLQMSIGQ